MTFSVSALVMVLQQASCFGPHLTTGCWAGGQEDAGRGLAAVDRLVAGKAQTPFARRSRCPRIPEPARAFSQRPLPITDRQVMITC